MTIGVLVLRDAVDRAVERPVEEDAGGLAAEARIVLLGKRAACVSPSAVSSVPPYMTRPGRRTASTASCAATRRRRPARAR